MKPGRLSPKSPSARRHLIVVDEADLVLGKADQDGCHSGEGILHSAFPAMIFDRQGRLLQGRRSRHKRLCPLCWDGTVAGDFYAGENREETVKKRIAEEIDLACPFVEGEALQREKRPDQVFSDPLGLGLCPGPDPAVNIEAGVTPGEEAFCPFLTQEFLVDK
jgi:hypothetical protein